MSQKTPPTKKRDEYPQTFAMGTLLGIAVGSVVTLLYTPISNRQIGQKLRGVFDQSRQQVDTLADKWRGETVEDALEEGRAHAHQHRAIYAKRLSSTNADDT